MYQVPLIKFDHPIHPIILPPTSPVLPPPDRTNTRLNIGGMGGDQLVSSKMYANVVVVLMER